MDDTIVYIFKVICYFIFVFLLYFYTSQRERKIENNKIKGKKLTIFAIIIFSCILGYYSIICGKIPYESDRLHYVKGFLDPEYGNYSNTNSIGLNWIESLIRIFTTNPNSLFFVISFIYLFLTLIAYREYENANSLAILYIGLSNYCIYSFHLLKQAPSMALIALAFVFYSKKKNVLSILAIILAICFHEAAIIAIPLYLAIIGSKTKKMRIIEYLILFIVTLFFKQINRSIISLVNIIPGMSLQLSYYIDDSGGIQETLNFLTILKGIPIYIITIMGFLKKYELKDKIKGYEKYMLICAFASLTTLLSSYMYWMWRFAAYCYFIVFIFGSLMYKNITKSNDKLILKYIVSVIFGIVTLRLLLQYYFIYGGI